MNKMNLVFPNVFTIRLPDIKKRVMVVPINRDLNACLYLLINCFFK